MTKVSVIQAIDDVTNQNTSDNVILILRKNWQQKEPNYYVDTELCEASLEQYIRYKEPFSYELDSNPRLFDAPDLGRGIWNVWDIMEQISSGLEFIHNSKYLHLNLKPRNGKPTKYEVDISFVLCEIEDLESW